MKRVFSVFLSVFMVFGLVACGSESKDEEVVVENTPVNLYGDKEMVMGDLVYGINPDFKVNKSGDNEHDYDLVIHDEDIPAMNIKKLGLANDEIVTAIKEKNHIFDEALVQELGLDSYSYDVEYKKIGKEYICQMDFTMTKEEFKKLYSARMQDKNVIYTLYFVVCPNGQSYLITLFTYEDEQIYDLDDFVKHIDFSKFEKVEEKKKENNNTVDPELKAFLDSYEQFVDEYVEFMKLYQQNPTDLTLLAKYTDIMQRYTDFMSKYNALDEDEMSDADLAYYIDVTARIEKKLLEAL